MKKSEAYADGTLEFVLDREGRITKVTHTVRGAAYQFPYLIIEPETRSGALVWARAVDRYEKGKVIEENINYANDAKNAPKMTFEEWCEKSINQIRVSLLTSLVFARAANHSVQECNELLELIAAHGIGDMFPVGMPVPKLLAERRDKMLAEGRR